MPNSARGACGLASSASGEPEFVDDDRHRGAGAFYAQPSFQQLHGSNATGAGVDADLRPG